MGERWARLVSLLAAVAVWQLLSVAAQSPTLPPPASVTLVIAEQSSNGALWLHLSATLARVITSFAIAMLLGVTLGMWMGASPNANQWLDPLLVIALNVPALVIIILAYVWLGLGEVAAVVAVALNKIPMVTVATREGARAIDHTLMQVGQVYRLSRWRVWRHIYLPQLYPHLLGAGRNGLSLIWKIVLVVELLGRSNGVGFALANYFHDFDVAGILAYTITFTGLMLVFEAIIMRPLERQLNRWRT
jgi:ABC-type nitrate/sulfonate/bicarbonate transport system permease component